MLPLTHLETVLSKSITLVEQLSSNFDTVAKLSLKFFKTSKVEQEKVQFMSFLYKIYSIILSKHFPSMQKYPENGFFDIEVDPKQLSELKLPIMLIKKTTEKPFFAKKASFKRTVAKLEAFAELKAGNVDKAAEILGKEVFSMSNDDMILLNHLARNFPQFVDFYEKLGLEFLTFKEQEDFYQREPDFENTCKFIDFLISRADRYEQDLFASDSKLGKAVAAMRDSLQKATESSKKTILFAKNFRLGILYAFDRSWKKFEQKGVISPKLKEILDGMLHLALTSPHLASEFLQIFGEGPVSAALQEGAADAPSSPAGVLLRSKDPLECAARCVKEYFVALDSEPQALVKGEYRKADEWAEVALIKLNEKITHLQESKSEPEHRLQQLVNYHAYLASVAATLSPFNSLIALQVSYARNRLGLASTNLLSFEALDCKGN